MVDSLQQTFLDVQPRLLRLAASIVGPDAAGDVVQQAFLRLRRVNDTSVANPVAYSFKMVANESASFQRSATRRFLRNAKYLRLGGSTKDTNERRDPDVEQALKRLSSQQRSIIHLTYWEDQTAVTVAAFLGVSEGSVKKQLARARETLRKELGNETR